MKRALLSFFLVALVYPVFSQKFPSNREIKHTTQSSRFRKSTQTADKQEKYFSLFDIGAIALKNNAQADSMMVSTYDQKSLTWTPLLKEYPEYHSQSTLIDELEIWYFGGNNYEPLYKYKAGYDNNNLSRIESHYFENGSWIPEIAEEILFGNWGEEIFWAFYYYDDYAGEWKMVEGIRAVDKHNENGVLVERLWEYYENEKWVVDYLEEYVLNEHDVIIEIIEYSYDDWDDTWEKEFRMVLELCENNMWQLGYAYFWDWDEEVWLPELKYESFEWFNFEKLQYSQLVAKANPDLFDDWDDWKSHDDIDWINYMRLTMEYTDDGMMTLLLQEIWEDLIWKEDWIPFIKLEIEYDQLSNVIYEAFSLYDGDDWMVFGQKLDIEYNNDGSIKSLHFYFIFSDWDDWKDELMPMLQYTFYYSDDTTDIDLVAFPVSELKLYPNPASNHIHLEIPGITGDANILLLNIDGRIAASYNQMSVLPGQTATIDVSGLKSGVYIILVNDANKKYTARFVKR